MVQHLGLHYICLRAADGKGISEFSLQEAETNLLPKLSTYNIRVSSIGSPIGKLDITDNIGFERQLVQLETLCKICFLFQCKFIRAFSFYLPDENKPRAAYREQVLSNIEKMVSIAERNQITLLNENEKGVYIERWTDCLDLIQTVNHPFYRCAFDFANFIQCGEDMETAWENLKQYVDDIYVKDAVRSNRQNVVCGIGEEKLHKL